MRIIIKAVPDRKEFIEYLQKRLPSAEWAMDSTRNAMDTFLLSLKMAGMGSALFLEEDIILTRDFERKIEEQVQMKPHTVIQFFSMRKADRTIGSRWDSDFMMAQCFYLPAGYAKALYDYYFNEYAAMTDRTDPDSLINRFFKSRKIKYWISVPSLVDHRVAKSLIDPRRSSKRQSFTFTDPWE